MGATSGRLTLVTGASRRCCWSQTQTTQLPEVQTVVAASPLRCARLRKGKCRYRSSLVVREAVTGMLGFGRRAVCNAEHPQSGWRANVIA